MKKNYYYILKRGYYYRPDSKGYTDKKEEAGIYSFDEMKKHLEHCKDLTCEKINQN
jgi:hypothetical protein